MPVMSMTGFGAADLVLGDATWRIEVKSVNHKGLSARVALPDALASCEAEVHAELRRRLIRGSVELRVVSEVEGPVTVTVNEPVAAALMRELQRVAAAVGAPPPTLELALRQADLVTVRRTLPALDALEPAFFSALSVALDRMVAMRHREGAALAADLMARLDGLAAMLESVAESAPDITAGLFTRLRQRVRALEQELNVELDQSRILSEIVVFSDKSDVTEELVRARSHLAQFRATLAGDEEGERGRRLDFLSQELLRELNTLGSKCRDAGVATAVVDAKVELEKIREQSQNIA